LEILRAAAAQQARETTNDAFASLVDEHGGSVYKFCRSLAYNKDDADDLFQEVFLKAFEQFGKISSSDSPKSFLFSNALYLWKSWKRRYARRSRLVPVGELCGSVPDDASLEDSFLAGEETRLIRGIVAELPEKFKIPIVMHYTSEMSVPDIASVLSLPDGTVKSRLFKARKLIGKGLRANGYEA
jgi:RNA polymerase sigma-70 factor (ECF subfamily)